MNGLSSKPGVVAVRISASLTKGQEQEFRAPGAKHEASVAGSIRRAVVNLLGRAKGVRFPLDTLPRT